MIGKLVFFTGLVSFRKALLANAIGNANMHFNLTYFSQASDKVVSRSQSRQRAGRIGTAYEQATRR